MLRMQMRFGVKKQRLFVVVCLWFGWWLVVVVGGWWLVVGGVGGWCQCLVLSV